MKRTKLELTWIGKEVRPRLEPRILLEDAALTYHAPHRVSADDIFDNRLICGDNLLALKALEQEFAGRVKCIFIDPPYNTGSAFEHYDDSVEHSLWLSLMRDRLEMLRRLLADDGSLWITIDDNEAHYLKVLCDEIFGRKNFVANCGELKESTRRAVESRDVRLKLKEAEQWTLRARHHRPRDLIGSTAQCAECEQSSSKLLMSRAGASLCAECVAAYYVACSDCGGFVAKDESLSRENLMLCPDCFSKPSGANGAVVVDETLIETLIAEYVSLHAEEKRIGDRMEVVKDQLKSAASARRRDGNTVTLRAGEAAIRCSYRASLKCDANATEALARLLDEAEFSQLFERKTSFTPVKDRIAEFLNDADESHQAARDAVRAALRETETVTLSVVTARKSSEK